MNGTDNKVLATKMIYAGRIINLRLDTLELPDGGEATREIVEHPGAVAVVAINPKGEVVLVRQYRHAAGETLLEIPAGLLEPGENQSECALRELREETGYQAANIRKLFSCYTTPGFSNEMIHIYLATDLTMFQQDLDPDEDIEILELPLTDAITLIEKGEITDTKTIAALCNVKLTINS